MKPAALGRLNTHKVSQLEKIGRGMKAVSQHAKASICSVRESLEDRETFAGQAA